MSQTRTKGYLTPFETGDIVSYHEDGGINWFAIAFRTCAVAVSVLWWIALYKLYWQLASTDYDWLSIALLTSIVATLTCGILWLNQQAGLVKSSQK